VVTPSSTTTLDLADHRTVPCHDSTHRYADAEHQARDLRPGKRATTLAADAIPGSADELRMPE
jgi:hypothetical protein